MRSIWQDLRYTLRQLRNAPGYALAVIAVVGLGIGANVAVFTILNGILLRPLPYAQADRVMVVKPEGHTPYMVISYANMLRLRDAVSAKMQVGAVFGDISASLTGPGGRLQVEQQMISAETFPMLGVHPALGRGFLTEENEPGKNRVVLLGDSVWRKLFNADPGVVGKTLTVRGQATTILGVMPRGFQFTFHSENQIWSPAPIPQESRTAVSDKGAIFGDYFVRLPDGMTAAQVGAGFDKAQAVVAKEVPAKEDDLPSRVTVTPYQESENKNVRKPLTLLYAVTFGIWVLACMNVTSLMLARATARAREQAVRSALGASRMRLLQQSVVESLVLSGLGAVAGLLLGQSAIKLLWRQIERMLPLTREISTDWRVIGVLVALTLVTAVVVGVIPALRASGRNVQGALHGVTSTASASQNRTREALVVAQLALTLVFLVGAGLFLRTIQALRQVPTGFSEQNVLTGGIILHPSNSMDDVEPLTKQANFVTTMYMPLLTRLRSMPGVQTAALSSVLPLRAEFAVQIGGQLDHKEVPWSQTPLADGRLASAGLVEALGIPMVRGRFFTEDDTASSPVVVVINQAFANKYLPGQDPIGHTYGMGKGRFAEARIVGEIGDLKQTKVTETTKPEIYYCLAQIDQDSPLYGIAVAFIQVAIRAGVPASTLRAQFDKVLHEVAPDATTTDVKTIHEAVEDSFGSQTLTARLLGGFAGLALLVATVGLYGLLSFTIAQRTREIGLRIALGAPERNILRLVLRRALVLMALGLAAGSVLAWFAVELAGSYLYGVKAHDTATFIAVIAVLATASLIAAWLPARRAAAIDPILALRSE